MQIVSLNPTHDGALRNFLEDFAAHGEDNIPAFFCDHNAPIEDIVADLDGWSRGERMDPRWVPCTTQFAIEEGVVLGVYNFRHHLNEGLERHGGHVGYSVRPSARGRGVATALLNHARSFGHELGLSTLVLTCSTDNIPSRRVIERNGGRLRDTFFDEEHSEETHRFDVPTLAGL